MRIEAATDPSRELCVARSGSGSHGQSASPSASPTPLLPLSLLAPLWPEKVNVSQLSNALVGIARRSFNEFQFQFQLQSEMYLALMPAQAQEEAGRRLGGTGSKPSAVLPFAVQSIY